MTNPQAYPRCSPLEAIGRYFPSPKPFTVGIGLPSLDAPASRSLNAASAGCGRFNPPPPEPLRRGLPRPPRTDILLRLVGPPLAP